MPFERYLRDDHVVNHNADYNYYYHDREADRHLAHRQHSYFPEPTIYDQPHAVQFQIPKFMLTGPPVLAPGGGAEVLPAGLLDSAPDPLASSWFTNNGFHSSLIPRQIPPGTTFPDVPFHVYDPSRSQRTPHAFSPRFAANVDLRLQSLPEPSPSLEVATNYISDLAASPSSGSSSSISYVPAQDPAPPLTVPSSFGLPVYSASGFDILSILSRVANRSNPTVQLGPVDLSCSFVIVDVRRYDSPIVYASPTFCHLTGYGEQEVLGRNCRFLQSPTGIVAKGEPRRFASPEAVSCMRKLLSSSKECQTTLINYRKGGQAFINLVTVIPLRGGVCNKPEEVDEVAYHIGFQVDLTKQPTRILDKLRDGSYYSPSNSAWGTSSLSVNGGLPGLAQDLGQLVQTHNMTSIGLKGGRHGQMMSIAVSKDLRNLIADSTFTDSVPISTGTNMSGPTCVPGASADQGSNVTTPLTMLVTPPSSSASMNRMSASGNTMAGSTPISLSPSLALLLLEFLPDFLLVLSLKGAFLYVAPSVRLVLGYEPQELVGRGISDVCHPADLVPLMRELKEGSVNGLNVSGTGDIGLSTGPASNLLPKSVDLLFRALPKAATCSPELGESRSSRPSSGTQSSPSSATPSSNGPSDQTTPSYVWLECRGRLHVEPGKGRKAIILSGRARWMPVVRWGSVDQAGGLRSVQHQGNSTAVDPSEFWALLSSQGTFLVASASVRDILGWGTSEVIGRNICTMIRDSRGGMRERVEAELARLDTFEPASIDPPPSIVATSLVHRDLHTVPVRLAFYRTPRSDKRTPSVSSTTLTPSTHPFGNPLCPVVCQVTVSSNKNTSGFGPSPSHPLGQIPGDTGELWPSTPSPGASIFGGLETFRGSSWQYELQQLKFANQRLQEELRALEGACAKSGDKTGTSSSTIRHTSTVSPSHLCSSSAPTASISIPSQPQLSQTQLHYTSFIPPALPTSPLRPSTSLHENDPPTSGWSSLAGANGHGPNPLKRSWHSEEGPTT